MVQDLKSLIITVKQFAVVHYFTKYGSGECYFSSDLSSESSSDEDDVKRNTERPGLLEAVRIVTKKEYMAVFEYNFLAIIVGERF